MTVPYGIHINNDALPGIATTLEDAATGLDDLAGSVPSSVDAGPMTAVISPLLAQVVTSAGNVANGLTALAGRVRQAHGYYQRTDADVAASLEQIESEMNR